MSKVILAVHFQRVGVLMSLTFLIKHYTLYFAGDHEARLSDSCLVGLGKVSMENNNNNNGKKCRLAHLN